jgi:hypothetical protein
MMTTSKKRRPSRRIYIFLLVVFLGISALACSLPTLPNLPFIQPSLPEVAGPGATPVGDTISYQAPAFAINLSPGETVPGTRLTYLDRAGDDFEVSIDGQTAIKRIGDSFYWSGGVAPGVYANYNLRLTTAILGNLPVAGPVEILVFNPQPVPVPDSGDPDAYLHYANLVLNYTVPVGTSVPGTNYVYEGVENQGVGEQSNQLARVRGPQDYPYLAPGDSLEWTGKLRDNVTVRYKLRVVSYDEESIFLVGTGDLWILN